MPGRVITFLFSAEDRATVASAVFPRTISTFARETDLIAALRSTNVSAVVWELSASTADQLHGVLEVAGGLGIPVLLRTTLSTATARELVRLGAHVRDVRVSLAGYDDLILDVQHLLRCASTRSPALVILDRLKDRALTPGMEVVVASTILGKRRTTVRACGVALSVPVRTLEARLRAEGFPVARQLLGWSVSLHLLWRIDVLGYTLKTAADLGGFSSSEAASNYVERQVGYRPGLLRRASGFQSLLEQYATRIVTT
jgi:hypothetical protein